MLLSTNKKIENLIVESLAEKGLRSAPDLQKSIAKKGVRSSLQGIYRVLRVLQSGGVVVKEGHRFSLRIPWILDLEALVEKMDRTYCNTEYLSYILPAAEGEKNKWRFNNILRMHNFWSQILLAMANASTGGVALSYCPHTWYENTHSMQEVQYRNTYFKKVKQYQIVGSRSFFDRYTVNQRLHTKKHEEFYLANKEELGLRNPNHYIDVIDDYVLTIRVSAKFAKEVDALYDAIESIEDIRANSMDPLFEAPMQCQLTLEKSVKKSLQYHNKFKKIFGSLKPVEK